MVGSVKTAKPQRYHEDAHGSRIAVTASRKSAALRVTNVSSWVSAVAAIQASITVPVEA